MMRFLGGLFYRCMQLWGWILRFTPQFLLNAIAAVGAFIWFDLAGFRRGVILQNLAHAFPREAEEASTEFKSRIYRLARKNLQNYFLGVFEILQRTTWSKSYLKKKVHIRGLENFHEAMAGGKGAFILTGHLGNWEVAFSITSWIDKPLSAIVRYVRNKFWDEVVAKMRAENPVNWMPETSSGIMAMRAYKKGELVVFVLDQHTGEPHGVPAKFFGLPAWTAKGLAILAGRLQAPIIPAYSYREGGNLFIVIEKAMDMADLGECREEAQILEHVQRCNNKIEQWVRQHPEQYFWIHRRFKTAIDYRNQKLPFP